MNTSISLCHVAILAVLAPVFFPSNTRSAALQRDLISKVPQPSRTALGHSLPASLSANGRLLAFVSQANNLVTNDDDRLVFDVFVRDLALGTTVLVSVSTNGVGGGDENSVGAVVSRDARWAAFNSASANLVAGDNNGLSDVFVRDLDLGLTLLGSVGTNGAAASGASGSPFLSDDGRLLFFESSASDLVVSDTNGTRDVFIRDLVSQVTALVSVDLTAAGPASGPTEITSISADGSFVAMLKRATNMIDGKRSEAEVYVRDRITGVTHWASQHARTNVPGTAYSCSPAVLSGNGRYVVFPVGAPNAAALVLVRYDLQTGTTESIGANVAPESLLQINRDGRFVAYETRFGIVLWDGSSATSRFVSENLPGLRVATTPSLALDAPRLAFLVMSNGTLSVVAQDWVMGQDWLVSVRTNGTPAAADPIAGGLMSGDGRSVAFATLDPEVLAEDQNQGLDVFIHELAEGRLTPISLRDSARASVTPALPSRSVAYGVNASGRTVAFSTYANDWGTNDTNGTADVIVRDVSSAIFSFLGENTGGSRQPRLSADGRYVAWSRFGLYSGSEQTVHWQDRMSGSNFAVRSGTSGTYLFADRVFPLDLNAEGDRLAFQSDAPIASLVPGVGDLNGSEPDLYLRDLRAGTNELVNVNRFGPGTGNRGASEPLFSPDGRWLTFRSAATDLVLAPPGTSGLYARDLVSKATLIINSSFTTTVDPGTRSFSADSRFIASTKLDSSILLFDFLARTSVTVCASCQNPSLSADARWVAYETLSGGGGQVLVLDRATGTVETMSRSLGSDAGGNGLSQLPSISHDGRYVVFASRASDLVAHDTNNTSDIFVRDRWLGVTWLASMNLAGTGPGNGASIQPILAADGRTVVFQSFASNLIPGDFNGTSDVFELRLGGPDSDRDGLDDDWEVAHFNTMDRNGAGDFDMDGASDLSEFRAGTDPTNVGKVLRLHTLSTTLAPVPSTRVTRLSWDSVPGRTYRVEFKATVDLAWQVVSDPRVAAGTTTLYTHTSSESAGLGFYRVVLAMD